MGLINILDKATIDKIAAGEVVEKPESVVKELVENAIDAGAGHISVELRSGGTELIRVTDDGRGIAPEDVRNAFMPHATSKLSAIEDLLTINSLGFRGEALSSISAVSMTELITKCPSEVTGVRFCIEGGVETCYEEVGAPEGTTILVRSLFYNTPARKKFLKSAAAEGSAVSSLMEQFALSYPDISFQVKIGGKDILSTTGNGDLREVIYRVYGREISKELMPLEASRDGMRLSGYIAGPVIVRKNRSMEIFFVNGRPVHDRVLCRASEDGYAGFLMQHSFPFVVLSLTLPGDEVDVNVHPRKSEVRFMEENAVFSFVRSAVSDTLSGAQLIRRVRLEEFTPFMEKTGEDEPEPEPVKIPYVSPALPFEKKRISEEAFREELPESVSFPTEEEQPDFFSEGLLTRKAVDEYRFVGQVFKTFWVIEYHGEMLIIDQHAAHEKVKYERLMKGLKERKIPSQLCAPPVIVTLNSAQSHALKEYLKAFTDLGFEIEPFGENDYAIRAVPSDLYGLEEEELFISLLDEMSDTRLYSDISVLHDRLATMACKAAVKGNTVLSEAEARALIEELLSLEQPYNCPHGRPTMIRFSERELEKLFKRIV
ncbi:MAG: DNA mismatch repair endonuclease MutL [Lachnospiraceae bacterium]|nr:DNA mismatch repair endonuclease MutL [Lachnospiraceae bacterium]